MIYRRTKIADIEKIMEIIKQAQEYLKSQGINQWQDGYPDVNAISHDINEGYGFVLEEDGEVIATAAVSYDGEPTYKDIHEGKWLSDYSYAVIHRVAVDKNYKGKGLSSEIIKQVELDCHSKKVKSIKVDTHEQNVVMQNLLKKHGFSYCGFIYLESGDKRLAFEKLLTE